VEKIIAVTKEHFEGHTHPQSPPKIHLQAWRVVPHPFNVLARVQGLMWGGRGPFLPAAAMVVAVVTPVVCCAKATEILKNSKNNQISCFYKKNYLKLYIV
jgi:hypothetical protein